MVALVDNCGKAWFSFDFFSLLSVYQTVCTLLSACSRLFSGLDDTSLLDLESEMGRSDDYAELKPDRLSSVTWNTCIIELFGDLLYSR